MKLGRGLLSQFTPFRYFTSFFFSIILHQRHNGCDGVSNHRRLDCLLNCLFRCKPKNKSKLRVTGLCLGIHRWPVNSPHKGSVTPKSFPFGDVAMMKNPPPIEYHIHIWQVSSHLISADTCHIWIWEKETRSWRHYDDVIMSAIASQITSLTIVYSTVYPGVDQSKHQSSTSLAFVRVIHRGRGKCFHLMTSSCGPCDK